MSRSVLVNTPELAGEALSAFQTAARAGNDLLAFDTETTGLNVRSGLHDYGRTIQFSWRPWDVSYVFEMTEEWRPMVAAIFQTAGAVLGHNVKFDLHVAETYGVPVVSMFPARAIHDTRFLARLHDERTSNKLKDLGVIYLRADAADEQSKLKRLMTANGWTWATVPITELVQYGGEDAILTGLLFDALRNRIPYAEGAYAREQDLTPILFKMERTGLLVDQDLLGSIITEERTAMEAAAEVIERMAPGLNINSPKQVKEAFEERGYALADTQASTLMALGDPLANSIIAFRGHSKTLNTYALPWLNFITSEGRIHSSLNQMGTVTGRFSSDLPNFQNIPKSHGLRKAIVAGDGQTMVVADWNQMELRLYAHFARDEAMRSVFLSNGDLYQQVADILGVTRQVGKMICLASIYGAGPSKLSTQVVAMAWKYGMGDLVPALQAMDWEATHALFHASYKIRDLAQLTEAAARKRGTLGAPYILTLGGRRQRPKRLSLKPLASGYVPVVDVYKDLGNSLVQGSSSDLMKMSLIAMDEAGLGDFLRLTVHDEAVLEVPERMADEVGQTVKRIMTRSEFVPPLTAEVTSAKSYGEAK